MKLILTLTFFLPILLQKEAACSSYRPPKLLDFGAKLQERRVFGSNKVYAPPPSPTASNQSGRVFYPIGFGADPTGDKESSDAILDAIKEAFKMQSGLELMPGVRDLGGIVIDLQGGNFKISNPVRFPSGAGNLLVKEGTLRASETFPSDRHLVELWSRNSQKISPSDFNVTFQQTDGIYYEDITFRDILFDSSYRGGGISVIDSARTRITNCFFLHFTTEGILVQKGHETFVSNSYLGQHSTVGADKNEPQFSGTAIDIIGNDNVVTDVAIFSAAVGLILRGEANIITGVHCYNKATAFGGIGMLIKYVGNSYTRIDNSYLDFTPIVIEDPCRVHITNGFFLGDANIVLKSINGRISGLTIVNNMFSGRPEKNVPIIELDGQFTEIDQVVIDQNNVIGMSLKSTVGKLTVAGNGTQWVADFSSVLVFPNRISHFSYSFYTREKGTAMASHSITNVAGNVVVVESKEAVNGIVSVVVDQHNMAGESTFPN